MTKKLVLEVLTTKWCKLLRVRGQTGRGEDFAPQGKFIFNDFRLVSELHPSSEKDTLYVWGSRPITDNKVVVVLSEDWLERARAAVRAYNLFYMDAPGIKMHDDIEIIT